MRLPPVLTDCVVYLCSDEPPDENGIIERRPRGSAFMVAVRSENGEVGTPYFITARHCIEDRPLNQDIYIRIAARRMRDGAQTDIPTYKEDWLVSEVADVAILDPNWVNPRQTAFSRMVDFPSIATKDFIDDKYGRMYPAVNSDPYRMTVSCGDDVAIPGLFAQSPGKDDVLPVVRYGRIARMPTEPMALERHMGAETYSGLVCLIEANSWPGQSGSPVFWITSYQTGLGGPCDSVPQLLQVSYVASLLGILSAHCTTNQPIGDNESHGVGDRVQMNTGIAIVTPAQYLLALLMHDGLVKEREAGWNQAVEERRRANLPHND